jgi:hypothetical protein
MRLPAFAVAMLLSMQVASAQEPPLPAATATPAATASVRPELNIPDIPMAVEPSPLVPNTSPVPKKTVPTISELDAAFAHSSMGQAVEEQRLHLEWRKLQNRASQDPDVLAAKRAINSGSTDLEKRDAMRAYYKLFYSRMQGLAETPELKAYLEQKKQAILNSLAQPKVRPEPSAPAKPKR